MTAVAVLNTSLNAAIEHDCIAGLADVPDAPELCISCAINLPFCLFSPHFRSIVNPTRTPGSWRFIKNNPAR
jgi:hypothetical protein